MTSGFGGGMTGGTGGRRTDPRAERQGSQRTLAKARRTRIAKALPRVDASSVDEMWTVIAEHHELIGRACVQRLGDVPDAEDARADAIVRAADEGPEAAEINRLATLAREAVRRHRWWRRRHLDELAGLLSPPDGLDPETAAVWRVTLADAIRKLSPLERETLAAWVDGFSLSEAAWKLRISVDAFESRLRTVRRHLRALGLGIGAGLAGVLRRLRTRIRRSGSEAVAMARYALERLAMVGNNVAAAQAAVSCVLAILLVAGPATVGHREQSSGGTRPLTTPPSLDASVSMLGGAEAPVGGRASPLLPVSAPVGNPHLPKPGAGESFGDTQLTTATPAPDFGSTHIIVGIGAGENCGCQVLWRTIDGGATWQRGKTPLPLVKPEEGAYGQPIPAPSQGASTDDIAPPSTPRIVLPPAYPRDPRIILASAAAGHPQYIASSFDQRFDPLPLPSGQLAESAGLDDGDPRLFLATASGVTSYNLDTGTVDILLSQTAPEWEAPPLLATPFGDPTAAVVVLAADPEVLTSSPEVIGPGVIVCGRGGECEEHSAASLDQPPGVFAVSPNPTAHRVTVIGTSTELLVSWDSSDTFSSLPPLPGASFVASVAPTSDAVWVALGGDASHAEMVVANQSSTSWQSADSDPVLRTRSGELWSTSTDDVLAVILGLAVRCTSEPSDVWVPYCR